MTVSVKIGVLWESWFVLKSDPASLKFHVNQTSEIFHLYFCCHSRPKWTDKYLPFESRHLRTREYYFRRNGNRELWRLVKNTSHWTARQRKTNQGNGEQNLLISPPRCWKYCRGILWATKGWFSFTGYVQHSGLPSPQILSRAAWDNEFKHHHSRESSTNSSAMTGTIQSKNSPNGDIRIFGRPDEVISDAVKIFTNFHEDNP